MKKLAAPIPRVALTPAEAAAALGVGPDFFDEHVRPELEWVYRGRKRLVAVRELERWVGENAEAPLSHSLADCQPSRSTNNRASASAAAQNRRTL